MYIIDKLQQTDYYNGYLELLEQLSIIDPEQIDQLEFYEHVNNMSDNNQTFVIRNNDTRTIIGSGTILIEHKVLHNMGKVGHIEDVVISADYRGNKLGKYLIEFLTNYAKLNRCYKVILNCSESNQPFYEKQGFHKKELCMAQYF